MPHAGYGAATIIDGQTGFPYKMNIVILCYIRTITSKSTAV